MNDVKAMWMLAIIAIIIGLFLRYGATTVPVASTASTTITHIIDDLTLKGTGYPYESPKGSS